MTLPRSLCLSLFALASLTGCNSNGDLAADLMPNGSARAFSLTLPETSPVPRFRDDLPPAAAVAADPLPAAERVPVVEPVISSPSGFAGSPVQAAVFTNVEAPAARLSPPGGVAARSPELDRLIAQYAALYEVPEALVRRVVKRESTFNPKARNGPYWGLMQILPATARGMGYRGSPAGLLDAETNLKYAVKYLRGAYLVADGNHDRAVRFYSRGYYYDAKRKGLLEETGLRPARRRLLHPEAAQPGVATDADGVSAAASKRRVRQADGRGRRAAKAGRVIAAPDFSYR